jgi:hypothetical protein
MTIKTKNIPTGSIVAWVRTVHVLIATKGSTMVTVHDGKVEIFNNVDPEYEWCTKPRGTHDCENAGHIIVASKV